MKLSAYKALIAEDHLIATIFDLTERFPRGPKAKLRRKDYDEEREHYRSEPKSDKLVGGDLGYDMHELYKLTQMGISYHYLTMMMTKVKDAAMGEDDGKWNYETKEFEKSGFVKIFKVGPQVTRRVRRLDNRLREIKKMVEASSNKNIYDISCGELRAPVSVFGDSEVHALQQFDLLVKGAFDAGMASGLTSTGWRGSKTTTDRTAVYRGPSHGPHEIMAANERFTKAILAKQVNMRQCIDKMKAQLIASEDLIQMVEMFTMNVCAQQFGDAEYSGDAE